ncbi:hypothetical protein AB4K20DRAFT_1942287 [Rhizopus microsporus]
MPAANEYCSGVAASLRWITPRCSYCYGSASTADEWPVNPPSSILLNSAVAMLQRFNIPMSPQSSPLSKRFVLGT